MSAADQILLTMQQQGPILPADAAKAIHSSILIASAHLSELASRSKVRISSVKVGGSPLYYIPGHEARLQEFIENLDEKEVRAVQLLREKKVIRDVEAEPLTRVALRSVKDFAVPLNVTSGGQQETFWKWYLVSDEEATQLIRTALEPPAAAPAKPVFIPPQQQRQAMPQPALQASPLSFPSMPQQQSPLKPLQPATLSQSPPPRPMGAQRSIQREKPALQPERGKALQKQPPQPLQQRLQPPEPPKAARKKPPKQALGGFTSSIKELFGQKHITVTAEEVIRKDAEINYILQLPSAFGSLTYLCKASGKKRITEKDLSAALVDGQLRKLPVIFLHNGVLNAKAQELLKSDTFRGMVVYRVGGGE